MQISFIFSFYFINLLWSQFLLYFGHNSNFRYLIVHWCCSSTSHQSVWLLPPKNVTINDKITTLSPFWPPNEIGFYRGHMTLTWPKLNTNPQKTPACKISSHLVHWGLSYRHHLIQEPGLCSPPFQIFQAFGIIQSPLPFFIFCSLRLKKAWGWTPQLNVAYHHPAIFLNVFLYVLRYKW